MLLFNLSIPKYSRKFHDQLWTHSDILNRLYCLLVTVITYQSWQHLHPLFGILLSLYLSGYYWNIFKHKKMPHAAHKMKKDTNFNKWKWIYGQQWRFNGRQLYKIKSKSGSFQLFILQMYLNVWIFNLKLLSYKSLWPLICIIFFSWFVSQSLLCISFFSEKELSSHIVRRENLR